MAHVSNTKSVDESKGRPSSDSDATKYGLAVLGLPVGLSRCCDAKAFKRLVLMFPCCSRT